jgi:hypothetical protein
MIQKEEFLGMTHGKQMDENCTAETRIPVKMTTEYSLTLCVVSLQSVYCSKNSVHKESQYAHAQA